MAIRYGVVFLLVQRRVLDKPFKKLNQSLNKITNKLY